VISEHIDPRGKAYFWIGEEYFNKNSADGTDYQAVELGFASVTPLKADMTDHNALTTIETWNYLSSSELILKE
jgi:5'-nucleotidase